MKMIHWIGMCLALIIMVPVNSSGQPDYDYMEQYTKNLMIKKYRQYLDYVDVKSAK